MEAVFSTADAPALVGALDVLDHAIEAAQKANHKLGVPTLPIDAMQAQAARIRRELKSGSAFALAANLLPTLLTGFRLYAEELSKVGEKQMKLSLLPTDTEERLKLVKAIQERIGEQLPLQGVRDAAQRVVDSIPEGGSMTFESGGESVTIEGRKGRRAEARN